MNEMAFAIHLGGGLYMDSKGNLHQSEPPDVPVYEAPFHLPVDPKKVGNALNDVKKGLKDFTEDKEVLEKFVEWGLDPKLLVLLSTVGKAAGYIAPVFLVLSFAIDIAILFGWLKEGPDAFEELVKQRFAELEDHVHAVADLIESGRLEAGRLAVEGFSTRIKDHLDQLNNLNPSMAQLENDRVIFWNLYDQNRPGIASLLDVQTWQGVFDRDQYTRVWAWIETVLYTHPGRPGAAPAQALLPPDGTLHLDHRLMVPLAAFAALNYLACIRVISPEYRTTGDFRSDLIDFAKKLNVLALSMREHVLARTIYRPEHFSQPLGIMPWDVIDVPPFLPEEDIKISSMCSLWPVGALDLRYHDNNYFSGFLAKLAKSELYGWPHRTKHGGMDFRWIPPAKLTRSPDLVSDGWRYSITNPEECAAAANAQSEKDYAELLAMSGYMELLLLSTLFRNEATEPNVSQTVSIKTPLLYRTPKSLKQVTVKSEDILMTGVISSPATREQQECVGKVEVQTQPIKRARPLEYTVKLRTLASIVPENRWQEPAYRSYHWTQYDQDFNEPIEPNDPGFLRLGVYTSNLAVAEHTLIAGSSPREPRHVEGEIKLKAHTFDWWIPVKSPYSPLEPFIYTEMELRAFGRADSGVLPKTTLDPATMLPISPLGANGLDSFGPSIAELIPRLSWKSGAQDWDGEHRKVKEAEVQIKYKLDWYGDKLNLTIENRPSDRNYVVYLVIEEKMPGTGQVLHTAVPIPVNGRLTYVPQAFFDEEREAYAQIAKTIGDFNRRYSEMVEIGPLDPIIGWVRPGNLASIQGFERILELAEQHQPDLLHEVMEEHMRVDAAKAV